MKPRADKSELKTFLASPESVGLTHDEIAVRFGVSHNVVYRADRSIHGATRKRRKALIPAELRKPRAPYKTIKSKTRIKLEALILADSDSTVEEIAIQSGYCKSYVVKVARKLVIAGRHNELITNFAIPDKRVDPGVAERIALIRAEKIALKRNDLDLDLDPDEESPPLLSTADLFAEWRRIKARHATLDWRHQAEHVKGTTPISTAGRDKIKERRDRELRRVVNRPDRKLYPWQNAESFRENP